MTTNDLWPSPQLADAAFDMPENPRRVMEVLQRRRLRHRRNIAASLLILVVTAGAAGAAWRGTGRAVRVATTAPTTGRPSTSTPTTSTPPRTGDDARAYLISQLHRHGLEAEITGELHQLFLHASSGWVVHVQGAGISRPADVQVDEYNSVGAAATDAERFRPDGSIEDRLPNGYVQRVIPEWIAPPHVYRSGPLLVIYVGSDTALRTILATILGPPLVG